ncbi:MAG: UvrD-helicase domain-containing protein, partial [Erythrobacter sp.]|nr:UvrD-helicase domain-containing protein [Erythrobacter sp.]
WLLASFPEEAGITPGARAMDDRQRELLAREVLTAMLAEAEATHDTRILDAVHLFVTRKDVGKLHGWLLRCAAREELWEGSQGWQSPVEARVRRLLDMPADADEAWACEGLEPEIFPDDHIHAMIPALEAWGTKTGDKCLVFLREWLSLDLAGRTGRVGGFKGTLLKADGTPSLSLKKPRETDPGFIDAQEAVAHALAMFTERRILLDLAQLLSAALELGRAFALRWAEAKRREGLMDFDDLIRRAAALLRQSGTADWIRYKLDRRFDHILIDEAQDTNQAQWDIVEALIDDFFSGEGAHGDRLRTIFTVGDYKQAIFGFQGTSPENYERARVRIRQRILDARAHAQGLRERRNVPGWLPLDLERSYRTAQPVLDFVNQAIRAIGPEAFGLPQAPPDHSGDDRAGLVTLWEPVRAAQSDEDDTDPDERDWLPHHETVLAERIARQVAEWLRGPDRFVLEKGTRRHATPGDVMVLVRKRGGLAAEIVAKLHEARVAVAGVDRLRLSKPLAVRDVMSALRFAAQPLDDLECANLLASPLIGWTQDDLLEHVPRPDKTRLWDHLRRKDAPPFVAETAERLRDLLARADYETPQALIVWLLTGPWAGRARLVERLGREANDPLDELLNAAFAYEGADTPSLAGFIEWFDAGAGELKRDPDDAGGQVRVMTVHGSKGLQAPIVILADATGKPGEGSDLDLEETVAGQAGFAVPIPALRAEERVGPVRDAAESASAADMAEHWRLLYVAMTRAEEALFLTGALGKNDAKNGPHEDSWFARLAPLFGDEALDDPIWVARRELGARAEPLVEAGDATSPAEPPPALPRWALAPIGPEPRPPRPLAPSGAGEDRGAEPPLEPAGEAASQRLAMRRGVLIHRLLERLPDCAPDAREERARTWLARHGADLPEDMRAAMIAQALGVLDAPAMAGLFAPGALAEVPLTATVGGIVITGTADRLLVEANRVTVVDFKTTRRPPRDAGSVSPSTLSQMAAYVAALEAIYPGREVRACVLYTQTPHLIELPAELIASHKERLAPAQQSYGDAGPLAY